MVLPSSIKPVDDLLRIPDDRYTLPELTNYAEGHMDDQVAGNWVKSVVQSIHKRIRSVVTVSVTERIPELLYWPFRGNYTLIPDVTVTKFSLAILAFEVVSNSDYKSFQSCYEWH